jgi:rare lipoprotein A
MVPQTLRQENKFATVKARSLPKEGRNTVAGVLAVVLFFCLTFSSCTSAFAETASYYTYQSCVREGTSGVWTASGERFNENDLTCALRSRDFGKSYKVTNLDNGKSVIVRHNDFGPNKKLHNKGRIIDLSKGAFQSIANLKTGVINVKVEAI